jgi:hypothetical protein
MKPYDDLKEFESNPVFKGFGPGVFYCIPSKSACVENGFLKVHIKYVGSNELHLLIGNPDFHCFSVNKESAKVLSEFFAEVSESLM